MTKLIAAAAGLAVAGSAFAQLETFAIDAWTSGTSGAQLVTAPISGNFYQNAFGADLSSGINPAFIPAFPAIVFDSYVSLGTGPVAASGINSVAVQVADSYGPFEFAAGEVNGSFFSTAQPGSVGGDSDFDIFLGRFTTLDDAGISGEVQIGNLRRDGAVVAVTTLLAIGGPAVQAGDQAYQLRVESFQADADGQTVFVNDLYVEAIPTPGAAGLLGLAGLAAVRRRR